MDQQSIKIIVLGDPGVGKTCMIANLSKEPIPLTYVPTIEQKVSRLQLIVKKGIVNISIWDLPSKQEYMTYSSSFYEGANGAIIAYTVTDIESFNHVNLWIQNLNEVLSEVNIKKVIVGLKSDSKNIIVDKKEGEYKASSLECRHFWCSNKDKNTIETMFNDLLEQLVEGSLMNKPNTPLPSEGKLNCCCTCAIL